MNVSREFVLIRMKMVRVHDYVTRNRSQLRRYGRLNASHFIFARGGGGGGGGRYFTVLAANLLIFLTMSNVTSYAVRKYFKGGFVQNN